ncbi:gag-pol polyprotein [Tanacetum coccineum]
MHTAECLTKTEEYSEEEVVKTMAETMEQYMRKTRADYGSGVARPKIEDKDNFELKGQFLKELRTNTFSGSDHEDANEHIKKVLEIVDLFHIPNITIDQVMLRAFPMSLTGAASRWLRNKPSGSITTWEDLKIKMQEVVLFYNGLDVPTRQILDSRGAIPLKTTVMMRTNSYGALHIDNSIPRKEKDPGSCTLPCYINNVCFDNTIADLGASVSVMPFSTYLNLGLGELAHSKLIVELADRTVKYPKRIAENVLVEIGKFVFPDFIILDMPEDVKVPLILRRTFFLIKRVYMLSLRERMKLDLEARLMGESLVLNRSMDPIYGDYIELNDLNVPLELRRDQVDDLMPTIKEGEVIEELKARNDNKMVSKIYGYPSDYDQDEKIHIDCAYNLKFSCMIVVENMDPYLDEGMGEVVVGEPFCKVSCVETKRFDGMITIHAITEGPRWKEIDNVGEVSTIWNSCSLNLHGESTKQISGEFLILILFNFHF